MALSIDIAANTRVAQRNVKDLSKALDDTADSLDDLTRDGDQAGDKIEGSFRELVRSADKAEKAIENTEDALKSAARRAKDLGDAGDDAGKSVKRGMEGAEDGVEELRSEAASTAKEAAASFDGSAESIIDAFQEVAANAFAGFGPAGALAGLAIAAGIGIAVNAFQQAQEAAEELRLKAVELAGDALDAGVSTDTWVSSAQRMVERIRELEELKSTDWRWFWEDDPTQLEEWADALKRMGRGTEEIGSVLRGTTEDVQEYRDAVQRSKDALDEEYDSIGRLGALATEEGRERLQALLDQSLAHKDVLEQLDEELAIRAQAEESQKRMTAAGIEDAAAAAAAAEEKAERIAAAEQAVQDSVLSAYDNMRGAATEYATTEEGALDINRWVQYMEEHRAAAEQYQANLATMKLTPEQWSNLMEMPEDARMQWVAQFVALPEEARPRYSAALNDLGSSGGSQAAVGFEDSFDPDADVEITAHTSKAERAVKEVAKDRTAEIKVKTTGKAAANEALDKVARDRTCTIRVNLDLSGAQRQMDNFIRSNSNRSIPVYGRYIGPAIGRAVR